VAALSITPAGRRHGCTGPRVIRRTVWRASDTCRAEEALATLPCRPVAEPLGHTPSVVNRGTHAAGDL